MNLDTPLSDLTNDEKRLAIAKELDYRPPNHQLQKKHLNALHAYFTGEFAIPMSEFGTSDIDYESVLAQTIGAAMTHATLPKYQGEDAPKRPLAIHQEAAVSGDREFPPPAMDSETLDDLLWAMQDCDDQRDWLEADDAE